MLQQAPTRTVRDYHSDSRHWDRYQPRDGDIVIGTAAKVGTTWTQQIVNLLVFQSAAPRSLNELSPWLDARIFAPLEVVLPMLEAQTHRRFIKTHLPMDALPVYDQVRYIHTARDGRDACMSFLNHFNSFTPFAWDSLDAIGAGDPTIGQPMPRPPKDAREFFHYWVGETAGPETPMMAQAYFDIENSFWSERGRSNVLLVHYNDLKVDLPGEMRRISDFLGIDTPEDLLPQLAEAATFDAMKRDGDQLLAGMDIAFEGGHQSFLHKGSNNRWQGVLTDADLELYRAAVDRNLAPGLKAWLEKGRLEAGDPVDLAD